MYSIGIDIGGMSVKIGIVNEFGEMVEKTRVNSTVNFNESINQTIETLKNLIISCNIDISKIKGIGIGCPGMVDSKNGIIKYLPNLNWENVPIKEMITKEIDLPIRISNDANVAVLGEMKYGCCKNYSDIVMLTLGTGVGGGIIINRKLFEGGFSCGAELGHITLVVDGKECACGRKGCFEKYASASALIEQTKAEMIKNKQSLLWEICDNNIDLIDGKSAFTCAKRKDETAMRIVDNFVKYLAEGIMSLLNIFRPEIVVIGGGISAEGDYLIDKIKKYCKKYNYGYQGVPVPKICVAMLKNDAGIIGASSLF